MIDLRFGLFWCGGKISYLRYLTFKSLRKFHPDSQIDLYVSKNGNKSIHNWGAEQQDFEKDESQKDYLDDIRELDVNVHEIEYFGHPNYCPIYQADLFRWWWLYYFGGFYLDTDQIILKSFEDLPLDNEFIYSRYQEPQCGDYLPTGVLGLQKGSDIGKIAMDNVPASYSPDNYNSSGPFFMRSLIININKDDAFNAPSDYFYPVASSSEVDKIYKGDFINLDESYCKHWYGGHPLSQKFNKNYTEEFAQKSDDTISVFLRKYGII